MLHEFIHQHFSESTGPILMKNLTYTGVEGLLEFLDEGTSLKYKASRIDDIHSWYPSKHYLGIGDSSGNDPEAYAYASVDPNLSSCARTKEQKNKISPIWPRMDEVYLDPCCRWRQQH